MIWRVTKPGAVDRAKRRWHWWFAWYPVRVPSKGRMSNQHKVWLQKVRRRIRTERIAFDHFCVWKYYCLPGDEFWLEREKDDKLTTGE